MAQYKRSREEIYCNSVNNNEHENPPKRPWDNCSSSCIVGESALASSSCKMDDETCTVSLDYLLRATDEELGIPPSPLSDLNKTDLEATYTSHDTENIWDGLTLQIELLSGIETVDGVKYIVYSTD
jgi:hypothetical protein